LNKYTNVIRKQDCHCKREEFQIKKELKSWVWWHLSIIPEAEVGELELENSLHYTVRH
jgi:hypothetical protein